MTMRQLIRTLALASFSLVTLASLNAHAADKLRLERLDLKNSPTFALYLSYVDSDGRVVGNKTKEDFKLIVDSAEQGAATGLKTFGETTEPINLVIVVQNSSAMEEAIEEVKKGIRTLAGSAGDKAKVALITFSADAKPVAQLGPSGEVEAAANTVVVDKEGVEVHLLDAVRNAIDMLAPVPKDQRKMIVLFSDGIDVNMERKAFVAMGKRAQEAGVVVDTIGYAPFEPGRLKNLNELSKQSNGSERSCKASSDVGTQFGNVADEVKKQYVALFESSIKGDGVKEHTFQAIIDSGGKSAYSNNVNSVIPKPVHAVKEKEGEGSHWFLWTVLVLVALGLIGAAVWLLLLRQPAPPPAPVVQAPTPAPAPAPAANIKTMAIDIQSDGKNQAIGWIVGCSGKIQDKTFKLKAKRTLIGTGQDCDIQVDDTFMSSHHAEVRWEMGAYKLVDLGSTNGIVVNAKKVREHELVDNDLFTVGKSEFKFKSIT
jgi:hypothetical protein